MLGVKSAYLITMVFPLGLLYRNHAINFTSKTEMLWNCRSFFPLSKWLLADHTIAIAVPNQIREHSKTAILYFQCKKQCSQKHNVLLKWKFTSSSYLSGLSALAHKMTTPAAGLVSFRGNKPMKIYTEDKE